jgi:N-acetylmuramoyl-L-alanine amidase
VKKTTLNRGPLWVLFLLLWGTHWMIPVPSLSAAGKAASLLKQAEREFTSLEQKKSLQRYRHNYEKVEKRYRKVYEGYPGTAEAAEALLRCGELYTLLHRWTSSFGDLDTSKGYYRSLLKEYPKSSPAVDAQMALAFLYLNYYNDPVQSYREFEKVPARWPKSNRRADAELWLKKLKRYRVKAKEAPAKPVAARGGADSPASLLSRAERGFADLKKKADRQRYRHNYEKVLDRYRRVFDRHPGTPEAEKSLLRAGELYTLLYKWTTSKSDLNRAKNYYQRLIDKYPASPLADDAQISIAYLYLNQYQDPARAYQEFQKVSWTDSRGDRKGEADRQLAKLRRYKPKESSATLSPSPSSVPAVLARVTGIRHWSNPEYTRVVIDLDQSTNFYSNLLKVSSAQKKPPRLYVDLFNTLVEKKLRSSIPVNDGILLSIRAGQFTPDTVRVVLDINKFKSYNIFPMENPFRIVIDATGGRLPDGRTVARPPSVPRAGVAGRYSLAQQLGLGIRRVVIDAGHGAHDPGAIGVGGLKEKDVTLDLALRLRDLLQSAGLEVILTRSGDSYLGLEERTAIANRSHADLFLSLHANSSRKKTLHGVETYFLNLASSERATETAAIENSMSLAKMSDLEEILQEIFNSKMDESSRLADSVQKTMIQYLRRSYQDVKDLGVKQAPFYVLLGAQMPSILAEVSFINHPVEGRRLSSQSYRQHLAEALSAGVQDYIRTVKTADLKP